MICHAFPGTIKAILCAEVCLFNIIDRLHELINSELHNSRTGILLCCDPRTWNCACPALTWINTFSVPYVADCPALAYYINVTIQIRESSNLIPSCIVVVTQSFLWYQSNSISNNKDSQLLKPTNYSSGVMYLESWLSFFF